MVGPHMTDLIEAGVVAIDAESTVETVADGMAPHPTLSEAIKEAGPRRARPRDPPPEPQARNRLKGRPYASPEKSATVLQPPQRGDGLHRLARVEESPCDEGAAPCRRSTARRRSRTGPIPFALG